MNPIKALAYWLTDGAVERELHRAESLNADPPLGDVLGVESLQAETPIYFTMADVCQRRNAARALPHAWN